MRHDDVDIRGHVGVRNPVGDGEPADDDRADTERRNSGVNDADDLEHLLGWIDRVCGSLELSAKRLESGPGRFASHSTASPNTSRPRRVRSGFTLRPSVAGANCSSISACKRSRSDRRLGSGSSRHASGS